jgi:cytochrome c oxidase subunit 4
MSHDHHEETHAHEPVGYGTYFLTWFALVFLTATTVTVAGLHLGGVSVLVALIIASIKASIVVWLFMHMKYEDRGLKLLIIVMLGFLSIMIGLTFTDILFRL